MSYFVANEISAGYGKQNVIQDISFGLEDGILMGVIGANGSGKTTLLKAICGILTHQGTCTLEQTVLEKLSPRQIAKIIHFRICIKQKDNFFVANGLCDTGAKWSIPKTSKFCLHPAKGKVTSSV